MILVAAGMFIAYILTFLLIPFIIRIARINKLYDKPDERKTHTSSISSLGGVGMVAGISVSILLVMDFTASNAAFQYYLASFFIIFMLGIIDDIFILHPLKKLAGQLMVAIILTTKAHLLITNLQGLGGFYELDITTSYILTFFAIILVINSFNLIDGVDGLAAGLGIASSTLFGLFFFVNGDISYAILAFTLTGSLLAFLFFNFPPAKIFMGDSGSMLIGLVNVILFIKLMQSGSGYLEFPVLSPLAIGFGIIMIPILDVLRVFIIRLTKGSSPFAPDRNHLHHLLLKKGFTHKKVSVTIFASSIILAVTAYLLNHININLTVVILSALFFSAVLVIRYFVKSDPLHVVENKDAKILNLYDSKEVATAKKSKKTETQLQ